MRIAMSFTNLGPYHLARAGAAGARLRAQGGELLVIETAGHERRYPWQAQRNAAPFRIVTLFAGAALEDLPDSACRRAMVEVLRHEAPDAVAVAGYVRPECLAALRWAGRRGRAAVMMSESGALDKPRIWWKEAVKARRVRRFGAALVGGPRHRDYLVSLGFPEERITLGYNAVDNDAFAAAVDAWSCRTDRPSDIPTRPYFLAVNRFVPEKNLQTLLHAFAGYRRQTRPERAWDLVLCGDGPCRAELEGLVESLGLRGAVHMPGFLQHPSIYAWFAFAGGFVHTSLSEPWGLVVNEAAASALPLLVTDRAGCVDTLVPDPPGTSGWRFDPRDNRALTELMLRLASLTESERRALGDRARAVAAAWGPERFARGLLDAIEIAQCKASKAAHKLVSSK